MTRLYGREELLSLYSQILQNEREKIIKVIKPATFISFIMEGIMNNEQEIDWSSKSRYDSRKALIDFLLDHNTLEHYIKFSQCVHYINETEAKDIFVFITDLMNVGLHDSIRRKGLVKLSPRPPAAHDKVVVLWIVATRDIFDCVNSLTPGTSYHCDNHDCQKSLLEDKFEIYTVCCDKQLKSAGRKFDDLLVRFLPCPNLVVYSGSCQTVSGASATGINSGDFVIVSSSTTTEYDLAAEVVHIAKLCTLKKWRDGDVVFSRKVIHVGQATKYSFEQGAVIHCPDVVTLHQAAEVCQIPTMAVVQVGGEAIEHYCQYTYAVLKEFVSSM